MTDEKIERTFIPALPGWTVVALHYDLKGVLCGDDDGPWISRSEIVAWEVTRIETRRTDRALRENRDLTPWMVHRYAEPITVEGHPYEISNRLWAIRSPSGKYEAPHEDGICFDNEAGFIEWCVECAKWRVEEEAKHVAKKAAS